MLGTKGIKTKRFILDTDPLNKEINDFLKAHDGNIFDILFSNGNVLIIYIADGKLDTEMFDSKYFELGRVIVTCGVNELIVENEQFRKDVISAMNCHCNKDWGDLGEEDKAMNDDAVKSGEDRILSAYKTCKGKIWIITERDRSVTTILFPGEY